MTEPDRPPLPDFVIGGAPKCGTTALFAYLEQHPGVYTTDPKEPHYFASAPLGRAVMKGDYSREGYGALFAGRRPGQVAGEGSTHYLHHAAAVAPFMASVVPDVRLVFCLRDPVARAHSHYLFRYSTAGPYDLGGVGSRTPFAEFARDPEVFSMGDYAANLAPFYEHFGADQVLVVLLDDFRRDLPALVDRVCDHVGADPSYGFDLSERENETAYPRWPRATRALDRAVAAAYVRLPRARRGRLLRARLRWLFDHAAPKPPLAAEDRAAVAEMHRPGVERLAQMIGRDLSHWAVP